MLTRKTVILAKRETTYGTDPAMTGTDGLLAWDVEIDIKGEVLKRDVMRDTLTQLPHVIGMKDVTLTFKTELKGRLVGTGVVPEIDPLLHACAFSTAAIVGTSTVYTPVSEETSIGSTSLKVYKDGNLHKITGSRGTFKINLEAGQYGVCEWEFSGKYNAIAASTIPNISGLGTEKPPIVYNASFNIGGFSPVCTRASIDCGNNVVQRASLNASYGVAGYRITGREPKLEFDADAVVESSNPFWGDWSGDVVDTFGVYLGVSAGNKINITGIFQYETNKYGDNDGVSTYECVAALCGSNNDSENDELTLTFA